MPSPNLRREVPAFQDVPDRWAQEHLLSEGEAAFDRQRQYDLAPPEVKQQMEQGHAPPDYPLMQLFKEESWD